MPGPGMGGMGPRGFLTDEEKNNMPKVTKELLLRIFSYLKPYWPQFLLVFTAILLSAAVGLLPSIITGRIVDQALVGENMSLLIRLVIMAFLALTASQVIGVVESYINAWISQRIIYDMKNQMYHHLEYMPHSFFTTEKQGDIITRMNTDIGGVSSVISGTLSSIVSNTATVVTTLAALFTMSIPLALVGILVIPLLILPSRTVGKARYKLLTASQAKNDELNQIINETLSVSGSMLVKLFTREEKEYERFVRVNGEVTELAIREQRSGRWFRVVMGMFTQVGPLLIYSAGGFLIINRLDPTLTVGTVTATVALVNRLYRPVEQLLNIQVDFTRSLALFTRIFDYLDRDIQIKNPENGQKPEVKNRDIRYSHVSFGYDEEKIILRDVDFTVPGGRMYAVVGPSGSGKSTLVNLIPRLYDVNGGSVSVAGVDVREFDLPYLRSRIGVVTQDTYLFNGTIRENLLYARDDATEEELEEACRAANIHDFILSQPDGYDTVVGNRGLKLSGGEKQRISIARVILKDPEILILDEATSALDSISESSIQNALEAMMEGRTSLVIAHRLSTILKADRILVVKDGVIKEQGSHDELLAAGGVYRELYETQFRDAIEYEKSGAKGTAGEQNNGFPFRPPALDIRAFSTVYSAEFLTPSDLEAISVFYRRARRYYREHGGQFRFNRLTEIITEAEEPAQAFAGVNAAVGETVAAAAGSEAPLHNFLIGFRDRETAGAPLAAVLDLITDSPETGEAYIGWFMVDPELQDQGIGSQMISDIRASLSAQEYTALSLSCPVENTRALEFWKSLGFYAEGAPAEHSGHMLQRMKRSI